MPEEPLDSDDEEPVSIEEFDRLRAEAANEWLRDVEETIARVRRDIELNGRTRPPLISVDELRAAGALDVPPEWRKSLSAGSVERDLFSMLDDNDEA